MPTEEGVIRLSKLKIEINILLFPQKYYLFTLVRVFSFK